MADRVYWITNRTQVEAVANPLRHDIVDRLTALGPLSIRKLATTLGRKPTAIYRHVAILQRVGLIRALMLPGGRGRPATTYEAIAPRMRLARAPYSHKNRTAMAKVARGVAAQSVRDYVAGFSSKHWSLEGPSRNLWFFRLFTAPSRKRLARINALLDELMELVWTPDPHPGQLISVAWFMSPTSRKAHPP